MQEKLLKLVGSFISSVIEGITQEVTERIDTIDNESVREIATDIVVDYDYTDIMTDHVTDVIDNYDFSSIVEDGIDDYDFSDRIDDAVADRVDHVLSVTDFSTYVESALDDYDFDYKVKCALEELDVSADCEQFSARLKALEERQVKIMDALITIGKSINSVT